MQSILPLVVIISAYSFVSGSNFTDCGSSARNVRSRVVGCEDEERCSFFVGRNATFLANFTARKFTTRLPEQQDENSICSLFLFQQIAATMTHRSAGDMDAARLKIFGLMGSVSIPFPVTPREVCNSVYDLQCPMAAERDYNLRIELPVRPFYPRMRLQVQVELQSKKNSTNKIVCSRFPIEIMNPQTATPMPETSSPVPQ